MADRLPDLTPIPFADLPDDAPFWTADPSQPEGNQDRRVVKSSLVSGMTAAFRFPSGGTAARPDTDELEGGETLLYFDTDVGKLIVWNGFAWVDTQGGAL